ncbi:MAG: hypothetical protein D6694_04670 [Gammaproteobacteria bacterium]|nr:MAG: hypothetical protein D6694_04670 [Gammaproteobacteria bacterium]
MSLHDLIRDCHDARATKIGGLFISMLEAAVEDWTERLIDMDDHDGKTRLQGAIRNVRYLLQRINEERPRQNSPNT